jgi:predicted membrane channel-forming protein YqfA (hemolysin III family)
MGRKKKMMPVWFFIGVLLVIYGVIILITAIGDLSSRSTVVLAQYHPGIWGGSLLIVIGCVYTFHFWPRNREEKSRSVFSDLMHIVTILASSESWPAESYERPNSGGRQQGPSDFVSLLLYEGPP